MSDTKIHGNSKEPHVVFNIVESSGTKTNNVNCYISSELVKMLDSEKLIFNELKMTLKEPSLGDLQKPVSIFKLKGKSTSGKHFRYTLKYRNAEEIEGFWVAEKNDRTFELYRQ